MDLKQTRILITNDDGITSPGIRVLEKVAKSLSDDVWVVAPEREQSATGCSITITSPIRIRRIHAKKFAVSGTPVDSVLVAVHKIMASSPPSLILSGINAGANLGDDIWYSGTVGAAMEGTLLGIQSIALSQMRVYGKKICWEQSSEYAGEIIGKITKQEWPAQTFININFPDIPKGMAPKIKLTPQGQTKLSNSLMEGLDPRGNEYLWIGLQRSGHNSFCNSDLYIVDSGYISITPLTLNMTNNESIKNFERMFK